MEINECLKDLMQRVTALEKEQRKYGSIRLNSFKCNKCENIFEYHANVLYLEDIYEYPKNEWRLCNDCLTRFIHWVGRDPKLE